MIDLVRMIGTGVTAGLIVLLFSNRFAIAREHASKRADFRSYVELFRQECENNRMTLTALAFHFARKHVPQFESKVQEVRHHIRTRHLTRFDDACAAFKRVNPMEGPGNDEWNDKALKTLLSILKELHDCAG